MLVNDAMTETGYCINLNYIQLLLIYFALLTAVVYTVRVVAVDCVVFVEFFLC